MYVFACSYVQYAADSPGVSFEQLPGVPASPRVESAIPIEKRFVSDADNCEITDQQTGLVWLRTPPSATQNFTQAVSTAITSTWCGHPAGTWRLPTIKELATLLDNQDSSSAADWLTKPSAAGGAGFDLGDHDYSLYWSSTPSKDEHHGIWYLDMLIGTANIVNAGNTTAIRLWPVRNNLKHARYKSAHRQIHV